MRFVLEPDPAWDFSQDRDGVFEVELSWPPDALAGRLEELVVSPRLAEALRAAKITGFATAPARGVFREDSFGVEPGTPPVELVRLVPGDDANHDVAYLPRVGLIVGERALSLLREHCDQVRAEPVTPSGEPAT